MSRYLTQPEEIELALMTMESNESGKDMQIQVGARTDASVQDAGRSDARPQGKQASNIQCV